MSNFKRRITPEQLDELTDEQKAKLREWWEPFAGDWYFGEPVHFLSDKGVNREWLITNGRTDTGWYRHSKYDAPPDAPKPLCESALPLLGIDQMIQFLQENGACWANNGCGCAWGIRLHNNYREIVCEMDGESLCDQLWQAVKAVLG